MTKAAPKLTHAQQKEIYAFVLCGVPDDVIAVTFGVGERTIRNIKRASIEHYPHVYHEAWSFNTAVDYCIKWITPVGEKRILEIFPSFSLPPPPRSSFEVWTRFR
jgi:hypothetical protein